MSDALIKSIGRNVQKWSNWTGNVECYAEQIFYPHTEQQIIDVVLKAKKEGKKIRVVGEGHSFSQLIETNSFIVSLRAFSGIVKVDNENMTATIKAGTSIKNANEAFSSMFD